MADIPSIPSLFLALTRRERILVVISVLALVVAYAASKDATEQMARADKAEAALAAVHAQVPPHSTEGPRASR